MRPTWNVFRRRRSFRRLALNACRHPATRPGRHWPSHAAAPAPVPLPAPTRAPCGRGPCRSGRLYARFGRAARLHGFRWASFTTSPAPALFAKAEPAIVPARGPSGHLAARATRCSWDPPASFRKRTLPTGQTRDSGLRSPCRSASYFTTVVWENKF
ncbi:hypothetical protein FA95DRAFT_28517 [Auriscalpium vulgare]|uniref:Uncharacterized protein n=1 Tax=Auriscalpium vulgare TaxID=40419 RepID=A0ACB8SBQ4_9AGAM|nr:hypothetical protein FA95DRAFT_28517 [Auriscalpium vulgare]